MGEGKFKLIPQSFTHLMFDSNPFDFLSSVEHKRRCLAENPSCSIPYNRVDSERN